MYELPTFPCFYPLLTTSKSIDFTGFLTNLLSSKFLLSKAAFFQAPDRRQIPDSRKPLGQCHKFSFHILLRRISISHSDLRILYYDIVTFSTVKFQVCICGMGLLQYRGRIIFPAHFCALHFSEPEWRATLLYALQVAFQYKTLPSDLLQRYHI